jgi:hypothetical protein
MPDDLKKVVTEKLLSLGAKTAVGQLVGQIILVSILVVAGGYLYERGPQITKSLGMLIVSFGFLAVFILLIVLFFKAFMTVVESPPSNKSDDKS